MYLDCLCVYIQHRVYMHVLQFSMDRSIKVRAHALAKYIFYALRAQSHSVTSPMRHAEHSRPLCGRPIAAVEAHRSERQTKKFNCIPRRERESESESEQATDRGDPRPSAEAGAAQHTVCLRGPGNPGTAFRNCTIVHT